MRLSMVMVLLAAMVTLVGAKAPVKGPVRKCLVVALSRDTTVSTGIESGLHDELSKQGIEASGLRTLLSTTTLTTSEVLDRLRAEHYDMVICLSPRKTIQIDPVGTPAKGTGLETCLKAGVTGKFPSGEPLDVNPMSMDLSNASTGAGTTSRTPIPTSSGSVAYTVGKGTLQVFHLPSGASQWKGTVHVKLPTDIQSNLRTTLIVREVMSALDKSKVLETP